MAVSSLRFRIEGENSSALRSLMEVKRAVHGLGDDLQSHIAGKLKGVFSVAVIEEVVRRTGEWAERLRDTSRELGIGVEELQALQLAARRTGMDVDKIHNFYQKIEVAATKATRSQKAFNETFGKLGIRMDELKGPNRLNTSELTNRVMGSNGPESAFVNIIGSKNLLQFKELQREMGGKNPEQYAKENSSQIVPAGQVSEMASAWEQIGEDLHSLGNKLAPLIAMVLNIVDGLLKMVNGVLGTIEFGYKGLSMLLGGLSAGAGPNNNPSLQDWAEEGRARNKSMVRTAKNFIPQMLTFGQWKPFGEEPTSPSLSKEARREAEGAAEGIMTLATLAGGKILASGGKSTEFRAPGSSEWTTKPMAPADVIAKGTRNTIISQLPRIAGIVGYDDIQSKASEVGGKLGAPNRGGILQGMGMGYGTGGGGSGNLAIGGVYGVDIQTKIVSLNTKMVSLLEAIVENTSPGDYGMGGENEASGL